jgi:formylglycine-generating enzyme required for sulfatase activity
VNKYKLGDLVQGKAAYISGDVAELVSRHETWPHIWLVQVHGSDGLTQWAEGDFEPYTPPATSQPAGEMILVPEGEFTMGDDRFDDEKPQRRVFLDAYLIGKNPVTVGEFKGYCADQGIDFSKFPGPHWGWLDNHPMVNVTWDQARAYCKWAGGDLPTEAQWEKAARGTDGREYPWGNEWDDSRLQCSNTRFGEAKSTAAVGSYPSGASPYGCLDMAGNVWDWCLDWYQADYSGLSDRNPTGPETGSRHVLRGGSWRSDDPDFFRSAYRFYSPPTNQYGYRGFRLSRPPATPSKPTAPVTDAKFDYPAWLASLEEVVRIGSQNGVLADGSWAGMSLEEIKNLKIECNNAKTDLAAADRLLEGAIRVDRRALINERDELEKRLKVAEDAAQLGARTTLALKNERDELQQRLDSLPICFGWTEEQWRDWLIRVWNCGNPKVFISSFLREAGVLPPEPESPAPEVDPIDAMTEAFARRLDGLRAAEHSDEEHTAEFRAAQRAFAASLRAMIDTEKKS